MKPPEKTVSFTLNGARVEAKVSPTMTLLELLRRDLMLTAAKEGCGKGECGACTVILNDTPQNSCLKLAISLTEDDRVTTLEGLANDPLMKQVQTSFIEEGAVQCGFCIPGMVMSSWHLLKHTPDPSPLQVKEHLAGNLCRCTGYRKIAAAVHAAAKTAAKAASAVTTAGNPGNGTDIGCATSTTNTHADKEQPK